MKEDKNPLENFSFESIPIGLRKCPFKKRRKRQAYFDQFCDKDRCALWDDERKRCGAMR